MELPPERRETGGRVPLGGDRRRRPESPENDPTAEGPTKEYPEEELEEGQESAGSEELRRRLGEKDRHIREVYDELAAAKLAAEAAVAKAEAGEIRVGELEEERERLKETLHAFEDEERKRRRWSGGQDRRVARLEREIERREAEIQRLQDLLERKSREAQSEVSSKEAALQDALRRVEGLQRDLEEREDEVARLRATKDGLKSELEMEYELRRRMAAPENRLRAGIELFNYSEHLSSIGSISRSLGRPEVHVALQEGPEPPVILTFTWNDTTWRTYAANPGLGVEEPRVYQIGGGEDPSGVKREPPNAHIGLGERVVLGL